MTSRLAQAHKFFWAKSPSYVGSATRTEYLRAYIRFMSYYVRDIVLRSGPNRSRRVSWGAFWRWMGWGR